MTFKKALVSVSDKTGLVELIEPLVNSGLEVVSTGGTAKFLRENSIPVTDVSSITKFPEVMDGRVKTLHPHIHMGLLSREGNTDDADLLKNYELSPFDLVIGNLYPFESALMKNVSDEELIEHIDIGGPSFLRAAAKNYQRITVLCDPLDYFKVLKSESVNLSFRKEMAAKVFRHVSHYDSIIARTLGVKNGDQSFKISGSLVDELRYGENPQQKASWYSSSSEGLHCSEILQGKKLSYNNLLDLDATLATLQEFNSPCCVAVKHLNPCGVATADRLLKAVQQSLRGDPVSVFGGIVAVNQTLGKDEAAELAKVFLECVVAPDFSSEALDILRAKKNLRLLRWPNLMSVKDNHQVKSINGGFLVQTKDIIEGKPHRDWKIIGLDPDEQMEKNIVMGLKVCAHLKSNAIAIVGNQQTLGLGMGQVNRVDAVKHAIQRWKRFHPKEREVVLVSDAFFPFADSIELCAEAGVSWVVQPGGSIKDHEVIEAARQLNVNLILTGKRHFYH